MENKKNKQIFQFQGNDRVFGACAHVTSVIWYVWYGIYNKKKFALKKETFYNFCLDCYRGD